MKYTEFWSLYEHWIDYMILDINWYEDIWDALKMDKYTWLNLNCLPKDLKEKILKSKPVDNIIVNWANYWIVLAEIFKELWIKSYNIVTDNNDRNIESLKRHWVIYIWSINDFLDLNIQSINWHFNCFRYGFINRNSFTWNLNLPYVLFYENEDSEKSINKLIESVKLNNQKTLNTYPNKLWNK